MRAAIVLAAGRGAGTFMWVIASSGLTFEESGIQAG
jgi:hypothetical protein